MKRQSTLGSLRRLIVVALAMVLAVILAPVGIAHGEEFSIADGDVAGLIDAINAANRNPDLDSILLAERGTYLLTAVDNETTLGNNGLPVISSRIDINGNGARIGRDSRSPEFRFFQIQDGGDLSMQDVQLTMGAVTQTGGTPESGYGGAIYVEHGGRLYLNQAVLSQNRAGAEGEGQGFGGAIYSQGDMELSGGEISENYAGASGGGIASGTGGAIHLQDVTFTRNQAEAGFGGGIYNGGDGGAILVQVTLEDNSARQCGGGIHNTGEMSITDGTVHGNSAYLVGGAICNRSMGPPVSMVIHDTEISNNVATGGEGGAINNAAPLTITDSQLLGNEAHGLADPLREAKGGAIYNFYDGHVTIESSQINNNTANGPNGGSAALDGGNALGGAIYNTGNGRLTLITVDLWGNVAEGGRGRDARTGDPTGGNGGYALGGAIYNGSHVGSEVGTASIEARDVWLQDNRAVGGIAGSGTPTGVPDGRQGSALGGGLFQRGRASTSHFSHSLFEANSAGDGGGINLFAGSFDATNTTFSGNTADQHGGGIATSAPDTGLYNVTVTLNRAELGGGGLAALGSSVRLSNSIVMDNFSSYGNWDCFAPGDTNIHSLGFNVLWQHGGCHPVAATDLNFPGWPGPPADIFHRRLDFNGGRTPTHALPDSSQAVDEGNLQGCLDAEGVLIRDDQRGEARPVDGDGDGRAVCDIGAYEFQPRRRR